MSSKKIRFGCAVLFCFIIPAALFANGNFETKTATIKLASLAPENTPWGTALNKFAADCARETNGAVKITVYHNAVSGNESDVLRKMKINQIQAAVFTSVGMGLVAPDVMTLSCPFLIRSDSELDVVLDKMRGSLETKIEEGGFVTLAWSKVGWVRFFSKSPVFVPADLKKQKVGTGNEIPAFTDVFKALGYQMVPVNLPDVVVALTSGAIDAVYQSPVNAAATQIFGIAKNMNSMKVAPFMGAVVINSETWRKIPDQYKDTILKLGRQMEAQNNQDVIKMENDALAAMVKYGLIINDCTASQEDEWVSDTQRSIPQLLGKTINKEVYEDMQAVLKSYRGN
jgi:TRAP-type C4-dicarboxylate transport system substrate-binding protein